ncbi:hypothetical protein MVLG_06841 [Microbotryum lychnidis-dioicae p1A1 Lamole]|uniref:Uncharacterized protein n=1 Tax=Microbotryum lychnidis-dioicae (strain p1A1 Lamole / MvSl-1064) TaxID=683840 RepID=U5HII6_USTV1|nr:hypothetical protein MVLG_06841 [Microbotryum lychnidis-dioicae p1A1 Lamole]|eukprot:KDE02609.1 hypothetical protein MVLG_06841 [Microbotryum lychnidis-dioicae p1A1 Lamole]
MRASNPAHPIGSSGFEEQEFQGDLWCASDEDEPTSPAQTAEEMPSSDDDIEDSSDNELHSNWSASSPVGQLRDDMILEALDAQKGRSWSPSLQP